MNLETEPAGASVEIRNYLDINGTWERLGRRHSAAFLPFGFFHVRVTKAGYAPAEITMAAANRRVVTLAPAASTPARMVLVTVPGNTYAVGIAKSVPLADYWIDKFEVTNGEFKQFVDAGGYRDQKYWTEPFHDGARVLSFDDAVARFRDSTGRPGPAAWQLGSFPDGQADFPVGGISWFEATAYANFAGKRLPTIYHWYRASNPEDLFSDILRFGNFDSQGPVRLASVRATVRGAHSTWRETSRNGARTSPYRRPAIHRSAEGGTNRPIATPSPTRETPGNGRRRTACA